MKTTKNILATALLSVFFLASCSDDDDAPTVVNEEEVITTVEVIFTSTDDNSVFGFVSADLDGDGPNPPVITLADVNFKTNTTYTGTVTFLNETETPAEDITEEVEEEADEHQVFITSGGGANFTFTATNFDSNGNPLGTTFTIATGEASTGNLTVTLRHEPTKPNDGLASAGGETDVQVTFPITVE